ncbi:TrmH family RNA methyltransferase [Magnetococcales bacterium HHB-1]
MDIIEAPHWKIPALTPFHYLIGKPEQRLKTHFIVEGVLIMQRLLRSALNIVTIFITDKQLARFSSPLPQDVPIYCMPEAVFNQGILRGYKSGIYALVERPKIRQPMDLLSKASVEKPIILAVLPNTTTPRNVGAIVRSAAGLGVTGLILGPSSADPFHRQAIRASMGAIFDFPWVRTDNIIEMIDLLNRHHIMVLAAHLDSHALPLSDIQNHIQQESSMGWAVVLGNEFSGLKKIWLERCALSVALPMHNQVDSLNVATAAAIFFYALSCISE